MTDAFDADLYRLVHRGNPGDRTWYRAFCRGAASVLELGCGDGRVTLPIAADGARVTGIEQHPGMLAAAEAALAGQPADVAARVRLLAGEMSTIDLGERFDRVIIPYTSLYCLPDDVAMVRCLENARRHLAPGGRLAFDGYTPDEDDEDAPTADDLTWLTTVHVDDARIEVYERGLHDPALRTYAVTYAHDIHDAGGRRRVRYTLRHHYLLPGEVSDLLARAGLRLDVMWGDFVGTPFDADADRMVVEASDAAAHGA